MSTVFKRVVELPDEALSLYWYGPLDAQLVLLCVHGWTLDHTSFLGQKDLASTSIAVATYDRRGFGLRDVRANFNQDLQDLIHIAEWISTSCIVFGVSQGARLALRAMAQRPDLFAGAVLQGGVVDGVQVAEDARDAIPLSYFKGLCAAGQIDQVRSEWLNHPLLKTGVSKQQLPDLTSMIQRWNGNDLLVEGGLPSPADISGLIDNYKEPILLLNGAHETSSRQAHAAYLQRHMNAELVRIDGAGHLVNWSHSTESNTAIGRWLGSHFLLSV